MMYEPDYSYRRLQVQISNCQRATTSIFRLCTQYVKNVLRTIYNGIAFIMHIYQNEYYYDAEISPKYNH